ncbi:MAG: hypothetical protein N2690_03755 [Rhodocyclaceae bacterium]|nr:hypothetical protein [Rhodocyclaceae bacterium]
MSRYLIAIGLIFVLLAGGVAIDRLYRAFAARHPQLGPFRNQDGACGCCANRCASDEPPGHR